MDDPRVLAFCEAFYEKHYDDADIADVTQALAAIDAVSPSPDALLSWIEGACVDELPHADIRAAIERFRARPISDTAQEENARPEIALDGEHQ